MNKLSQMLAQKSHILADGATGTNLFDMGLEAGDAPEIWNDTAPQKIAQLYQNVVDAGVDLFLTNSFGSNAARLKLHGAQKRAFELSRIAAEIGRDVADKAGRDIIVAGSVGPTGELMSPMGDLTFEIAVEIFHEQAEGLKAGGADVAWSETLSSMEEFEAAAQAFANADMAWCGTMSFDTAGRTMMGVTSVDMTQMVARFTHPPVAYGANCGVGASDLLRTILGFKNAEYPLIAKGNAGIPKYVEGHIHYDGTPDLMADYTRLAMDCGARIIGGCCGTTPDHLLQMRAAMDSHKIGMPPCPDEIQAKLGAFSSPTDGTQDATGSAAPRKRRGRRGG